MTRGVGGPAEISDSLRAQRSVLFLPTYPHYPFKGPVPLIPLKGMVRESVYLYKLLSGGCIELTL